MSKLYEEMKEGLQEAVLFLNGHSGIRKVHIPEEIDVRRIREKLKMTQQRFADSFGFSLDAVRHWEAGRRVPHGAARVLLKVIDSEPVVVQRVLSPHLVATRKPSSKRLPTKSRKTQASAA